MLLGELILEHKDSKALRVFSCGFPFAGLSGMVLCWITSLTVPGDRYDPAYTDIMSVNCIICLVSFIIFTLSFITYMLYRPLSWKKKEAEITLRIVITLLVLAVVFVNVQVSLIVFSGAD